MDEDKNSFRSARPDTRIVGGNANIPEPAIHLLQTLKTDVARMSKSYNDFHSVLVNRMGLNLKAGALYKREDLPRKNAEYVWDWFADYIANHRLYLKGYFDDTRGPGTDMRHAVLHALESTSKVSQLHITLVRENSELGGGVKMGLYDAMAQLIDEAPIRAQRTLRVVGAEATGIDEAEWREIAKGYLEEIDALDAKIAQDLLKINQSARSRG